jgi:hypothetical protein
MSASRLGGEFTLVHTSGLEESPISLRDFSQKYKLNRKEVSKLVKGLREEYKGWKKL